MNVQITRQPCVYMLLHQDAGKACNAKIHGIALLKIGCTRYDLESRIRAANAKYQTKFELLAFMPLPVDDIFRVETAIKRRVNDVFGPTTEYVYLGNEYIKDVLAIFREEACRAG